MLGTICKRSVKACGFHCQKQYADAHAEGDNVANFYSRFGNCEEVHRLKNPTNEELDEYFGQLINEEPKNKTEAIMVYYIGHGVEYKGNLNAVLVNEENNRSKYNLEGKAKELSKKRLVHVMFDCNRLIPNS